MAGGTGDTQQGWWVRDSSTNESSDQAQRLLTQAALRYTPEFMIEQLRRILAEHELIRPSLLRADSAAPAPSTYATRFASLDVQSRCDIVDTAQSLREFVEYPSHCGDLHFITQRLGHYPEGEDFVITDGVQRYRALLELGIEIVPCIVGRQREAFTGNRMVNRVSPVQENRMIEKSLEELDEQTIAIVLNLSGISHRLKKTLFKQLHPDVTTALDQGAITHTIDLLRLAIYARTLLTNSRVREHLDQS